MSEKIKVRIKQFDERPSHWNDKGKMDELMGQEIEVELRRNDNDLYYFDNGEASWRFHGSDFEAMEPVGLRQDSFKPSSPTDTQIGSILIEAESIVNGARATDYGSAKESFGKIASMSSLMLNGSEKESLFHDATLTDTIVCKVLMAVKLTREANKHKRDNLVDLSGYAELLNRLEKK